LSTSRDAWKAADLKRDPRILVHNAIASPDGNTEYKIRGRAIEESGRAAQQEYATAVDEAYFHRLSIGEFHLFQVEVSEIAVIRYDGKTARQYVATWPQGGEFGREVLTDTALAPPEPHVELLIPE
jgi:general stress protein 26